MILVSLFYILDSFIFFIAILYIKNILGKENSIYSTSFYNNVGDFPVWRKVRHNDIRYSEL